MSAPTLVPGGRTRTRVRAAASLGVLPLLTGPPIEGRLLGASSTGAWLAVAEEVLVLGAGDAVRLPNGIEMAGGPDARRLDHLAPGEPVVVGRHLVVAPGLRAGVERWWDPHPRLPSVTSQLVASRLGEVRAHGARSADYGLGAALAVGDEVRLLAAAQSLLGRGSGLTPEGDDLLAAALASYRLIGEALGDDAPVALVDAAAGELADLAARRTTSLSASLLRHACRGNVAAPVADVLQALAGHGRLDLAVDRLLQLGHSSGPALAAGVVVGAAAACGEAAP